MLAVIAAPLLVRLMLGADPKVNAPLTTAFAYLLLPQVIFYGLSSVFMAILNTRNVFGPPAWAPVANNVVAIATLGLYLMVPGELSVDPVRMGNAKIANPEDCGCRADACRSTCRQTDCDGDCEYVSVFDAYVFYPRISTVTAFYAVEPLTLMMSI